jgi:hypothetical protein
MNRYDDNISPQPSTIRHLDTFKTPETCITGSTSNNLLLPTFPTPPSDNDDSYHKYQIDYLKANQTPVLDSYQHSYQYSNNSNSNDSDILSAEKVAEAAVSSSRFKRRSRTTFTKHQVS